MNTDLLFLFGLVFVGMAGQFIKKMADLEAAGTLITPMQHVRSKPWSTLLAIFGGVFAAYVFHLMGQLNELAAIFTGFASTEAFDSLRARAVGRIATMTGTKQKPIEPPAPAQPDLPPDGLSRD